MAIYKELCRYYSPIPTSLNRGNDLPMYTIPMDRPTSTNPTHTTNIG